MGEPEIYRHHTNVSREPSQEIASLNLAREKTSFLDNGRRSHACDLHDAFIRRRDMEFVY